MTGRFKAALSLAILSLVAACTPPRPTVSVNQAVSQARAKEMGYADGVKPAAEPIDGTVLVVLPDEDRLRPFVNQIVALLAAQNRTAAVPAFNEFLDKEYGAQLAAGAEALAHSRLFKGMSQVVLNDTVNPDIGSYDYLVWYQVRSTRPNNAGPWSGVWLVRRAGSNIAHTANPDPGTPQGIPRYESFVASVHAAAVSLPKSAKDSPFSSGSGFLVSVAGDVLTNNHVVEACGRLEAVDTAGRREPVTVVATDEENDLALLRTPFKRPAGATFEGSTQAQRPGVGVVVTGYPLGTEMLGSEMKVTTGSLTAQQGLRGDTRYIQISAPAQQGNSGGPVFDENGRIVGVMQSKLNALQIAAMTGDIPQNVNFAISELVARTFLDTHDVKYTVASDTRHMSPPDIGDAARKVTVLVNCYDHKDAANANLVVLPTPGRPAPGQPAPAPAARPATASTEAPVERGAASGQKQQIGYFWDVDRACTSLGTPTVKVANPPAHGKVTVEASENYPDFPEGNASHACNERKVPVAVIFYQSDAGFTGADNFTVDEITPAGAFNHRAYAVNVR